ncbi:DUF3087 family protein [Ferrimonas balearica]|uniref:DUF3087 family protein n=1 Tax=Ferrimonas balearica TaxID=44012 RepID=UPI001C99174C|nr:DUF3087 family protein [Ferrimonas balearica]MBY5992870.1 DUF3087 domain-containing protein [Ferrimonas balearica]
MRLETVDKGRYRRQVNQVTLGFVGALALLSVALGAGLIALFGQGPSAPGESTGHFHLNLMGVILALGLCSAVLAGLRRHPRFHELFYVWQLKQMQNRLYRKLARIQAAAEGNDPKALSMLDFYHRSRKLVYELDNNTLTLSAVERDLARVVEQAEALDEPLPAFDPQWLADY